MGENEGKERTPSEPALGVRFVGRYAILGKLAAGGMATVHVGRLLGPVGFTRMVAIKRLHPEYARDPEFVSMFLDEARLAAKISHPNVVSTLDVVATGGELFLVMDYLQGQSLSWLIKQATKTGEPIPSRIVASILSGALQGLHAAHEARDERGIHLNIVHRDVSPQNIMVGADGLARVLDFGVAKAAGRIQNTREGHIKGKLAYMSPEQLQTDFVDRKADIYAASVVLWEALTSRRLFKGETEASTLAKILSGTVVPPSTVASWVPPALDAVVMRGLERDLSKRYVTAREMAIAIERAGNIASTAEVSEWLERVAKKELEEHVARIAAIEMSAGLTNTHGMESLAKALAEATEIDEDSSSSQVIRQAAKLNAETVPVPFVPAGPIDGESPTRVASQPDIGGENHSGESASQLSSVSLALGRRSGAPPNTTRPRTLVAATLIGAAAALVGAGLWLTTARASKPQSHESAARQASTVAPPAPPSSAATSAVAEAIPEATGTTAKDDALTDAAPKVAASVETSPSAAPRASAPPPATPVSSPKKPLPRKPRPPASPFDALGGRD